MKYFTFIPAVLLSLTSFNAFSDAYICKSITGTIQKLTSNPGCNILQEKSSHFSDVIFLGIPDTCFSGNLTATLEGNTPVTGISYSGLTVNGIGQLTAASVIRLKAGTIELGRIFTKDVVFNPGGGATTELLTMVGGSKTFNGGHGGIEITGDGLYQATTFTGQLCIQK
ncbi:MAG: hypothetical protein Q7U66_00885 [Methylobacter sp.]|nr:hypothetical protein [Methylobacter sp.]